MTFRLPLALLACLSLALSATGCDASLSFDRGVDGSGDVANQVFLLDGFDSIEVSGTFDVEIGVGDDYEVVIRIDDNLVDELAIQVRNGVLEVRLKNGVSVDNGTLEAMVHLPELRSLDVTGASSATVAGADGSHRFVVSGASDLNVVGDAASIDVQINGASSFAMTGAASSVDVVATGASDVDLDVDGVVSARVDLTGASSVSLQSADEVSGSLSGASDLTIPVGSVADVASSGASEVRRR